MSPRNRISPPLFLEMDFSVPPGVNENHVKRVLARIPERHQEDAFQEAWLSHLNGKGFLNRIRDYWRAIQNEYQPRQIKFNDDGDPYVLDADGRIRNLPAASEQQSNASAHIRRNSLRKAG